MLEELTLLNGRSDPTRSYCIPKSMKNFNLIQLPVNNLIVIKFKYIHPSYIKAELIENCLGLKRITISEYLHYKDELDTSYNTLAQHFNQFNKDWSVNIYNSDNFINLYKFSSQYN
jgi:precorrin-6B methylase 1